MSRLAAGAATRRRCRARSRCARSSAPRRSPCRLGAGLEGDRRRSARRVAQARPQPPRGAASPGRGREAPAGDVGRLLGAEQPHRRSPAGRVRRVRARWSGTYVEDRLRNDWLLELGRRRDWANFAAEYPALSHERRPRGHLLRARRTTSSPARTCARPALAAWLAQSDADDGCACSPRRWSTPSSSARPTSGGRCAPHRGRPAARRAPGGGRWSPTRRAARSTSSSTARRATWRARPAPRRATDAELTTLALVRLAASDPDAGRQPARRPLGARAARRPRVLRLGEHRAADRDQAAAGGRRPLPARRAACSARAAREIELVRTTRWPGRCAPRCAPTTAAARWQQVVQAINAMCLPSSRTPAWVYWKARGLQALARDSQDGEALLATQPRAARGIAGQLNFYGALAAEDLGQPQALPPRPAPLDPRRARRGRSRSRAWRARCS